MKKCLKSFALICLIFASCKPAEKKTNESDEAKKEYFPVKDYLLSEIAYVDSMPFKIVRFDTKNGKTDSSMILTRDFDRLAGHFISADLDSAAFEKNFKESSFMDQTTQTLTFDYTRQNEDTGVQRLDVLARPDPGFDKVRSIYMEQSRKVNDTSILERMTWTAKKSFQIIRLYTPAKGEAFSTQLKLVWDQH